jgi:methylenetetrahydrofolate reductase (NADPH)
VNSLDLRGGRLQLTTDRRAAVLGRGPAGRADLPGRAGGRSTRSARHDSREGVKLAGMEAEIRSVSVELSMPTRPDLTAIVERLARLPAAIGRVVLTDNHTATARLSPLSAIASVLEAGRGCSVCASTRDRNRLALFAHVTGAVALGADEIVCVGGDPIPGIPARDLSVTHLIARAREWVNPSVRIGAGCAVRLDDAGGPTPLTRRKVNAGASFLITQASFDPARAQAFADTLAAVGAEPVVGVPLVTTPRALAALARFAGQPPRWVVELVEAGRGLAVTERVLEGLAVERTHLYPIGAQAWERMGEVLG